MIEEQAVQGALRSEAVEEYKLLFQRWDDIDRRALTMKGWSTGGFAIVSAVYQNSSIASCLFISIGFLSIWMLEGIWKSWQHSFESRIEEIEKFFRDDIVFLPFQIGASWRQVYQPDGKSDIDLCMMIKEMMRLPCMLPYIIFFMYFIFLAARLAYQGSNAVAANFILI